MIYKNTGMKAFLPCILVLVIALLKGTASSTTNSEGSTTNSQSVISTSTSTVIPTTKSSEDTTTTPQSHNSTVTTEAYNTTDDNSTTSNIETSTPLGTTSPTPVNCTERCGEGANGCNAKKECICDPYFLSDGGRCIRQNYLIVIASVAGGVPLLILLLTCLGLCCKVRSLNKRINAYRKEDMYDVDDRRTNGIPGNAYEDVYHGQRPDAPIQAFDPPRKPLQQEDHSKDNRGYSPDEQKYYENSRPDPRDSAMADMMESSAYKNFNPSLGHINPRTDYSIKRPGYRKPAEEYPMQKRSDVLY